jgi:hypothetical protein
LLEAELTPGLEGLDQFKNPMTSSGIEPIPEAVNSFNQDVTELVL